MKRRNVLAGLAALVTAGCTRIGESEAFAGLVDGAEKLHRGAHRLIGGRRPMAREFTLADLSPDFRGNGNKDIDSVAGNAEIAIGDLNDYASMEATVKAGDLNVGAFTGAKTTDSFGLLQRASWSGKGKYTLRANLGAGNLVLRK